MNEEIQSGKIQNNRYILNFPLRFLLNFLNRKIKEREFQKKFCCSLPTLFLYIPTPSNYIYLTNPNIPISGIFGCMTVKLLNLKKPTTHVSKRGHYSNPLITAVKFGSRVGCTEEAESAVGLLSPPRPGGRPHYITYYLLHTGSRVFHAGHATAGSLKLRSL